MSSTLSHPQLLNAVIPNLLLLSGFLSCWKSQAFASEFSSLIELLVLQYLSKRNDRPGGKSFLKLMAALWIGLGRTFDLPTVRGHFLLILMVECLDGSTTGSQHCDVTVWVTELGSEHAAQFLCLLCQGLAQPSGMKSSVPFYRVIESWGSGRTSEIPKSTPTHHTH